MSNWSLILALIGVFASFPSRSYGYENDDLVSDDEPYVFMPPYRCLDRAYMEEGPRGRFFGMRRDIRDLMSEIHSEKNLEDKPDCGVIDPAMCKGEGQNYAINCNCHAYFTCNYLDASGDLKPCPHWCEPKELVFDPNTQVCVKFDIAPPGICYDTPSTSPEPVSPTTAEPTSAAPTTDAPTTEAPTTAEPTTAEPTTPKPTTAEPTTAEPTTPKPTTTEKATTPGPDPAEDCDFDGQKLPFPGNCHDYYVCFGDENGKFTVQVFSCGDDWVYDPNTGSCTWPEEAADDLCDY